MKYTTEKENRRSEYIDTLRTKTPRFHRTPSRDKTTLSVPVVESVKDIGFHPHPEPWHNEEHHDNVFKMIAAPTSVIAVGDKVQIFHSVAPMYHLEVFKTSEMTTDPQARVGAPQLPKTENTPEQPTAHTTKKSSHHHQHGARRRANHVPRRPSPRNHQASPSKRLNHDRKSKRDLLSRLTQHQSRYLG